MEFLLLLSVFAITQTIVLARPNDSNLRTKRSSNDPSRVFKPSSLKFPTELKDEFTVTINGTLDDKSGSFEVVFPSRNRKDDDHCRMKYDFNNNMLDMTPEHPDWKIEKYKLYNSIEVSDNPTFSLRLQTRTSDGVPLFRLIFEGNNSGESSPMICNLERFDYFERIEFGNGLHSITSFLVEFDN